MASASKNDKNVEKLKASPSSLGFSDDKITEVSLSCLDNSAIMGSTLIFQEGGSAYTLVDGTFLKLEKTL